MDSQYQRNFIDGVEFEETCLSKGHDSHRRNINVNEGICAESKVGISARETSRDVAFLQSDVMVVSDAINDTRSADNPLVTQESNLRFYAGAPMKTPKDHNLGTLCVIDRVPGELTQNQKKSLQALSRQVMARME